MMHLDDTLAMLKSVNAALAAEPAASVPAETMRPVAPPPRAPDDAHLDPAGRRYLVKSFVGGGWEVDRALVEKALLASRQNNDATMTLAAMEMARADEGALRTVAAREHAAEARVAPGAFLRDMAKSYSPGSPTALTGSGISAPPVVMGLVRRDARTGAIDTDSVVVLMMQAYAKASRGEGLSLQEKVLMAIGHPGHEDAILDPLSRQQLALVSEDEREQLRAVYEARLLEIIGYAQMKFGVIEGQHVTLRQS